MNAASTPLLKRASTGMRRRRFGFFRQLVRDLPRPIRILDVGGTESFWCEVDFASPSDVHVTILNLEMPQLTLANAAGMKGDARALPQIADRQFDIAFSNSVIEHVGDYADQCAMAAEMQRVGQRYFVQTPNRHFPLEPHFMVPGYQYLPESVAVWLLQHFRLGNVPRTPDRTQALNAVRATKLMTRSQLICAFPGARLYEERAFGLVKSYTCYGGF